jgi:hypothetical protein
MKVREYIVRVHEEDAELVTAVIEKLGAEAVEVKKSKTASKKANAKKKAAKPSPTFLFGKWKGFDIDPRKLREESWGRKF